MSSNIYKVLWSLLIISLPTANATARMRAWRALKQQGAAALRDGVYLLPATPACADAMAGVAADVRGHGGQAFVLRAEAPVDGDFAPLFDRRAEFGGLLAELATLRGALLASSDAHAARRQLRKLRKAFDALRAIDFFPGEAQAQVAQALQLIEAQVARLQSPDEPAAVDAALPRLQRADHHGRIWATRRRPWIDRLASAWLIRRFIDPAASFLWLADPAEAPPQALGFDFDGARFTHVGARVTFETLLACFGLEPDPALTRLGLLVHGLDAGGAQWPEAPGVERVLAGMREAIADDDQLLSVASGVFDGLYLTFQKDQDAS